MRYIPNSPLQVQRMLDEMGCTNIDELFRGIPTELLLNKGLDIEDGKSELEVIRSIEKLASENKHIAREQSFLGAGAYNHFIPSIIDSLVSRAEFFTAYTPYQPEVSQGTLQAIFEYQTMMSALTGMDVTNASMYDGATAVTEAVLMAHRIKRGNKVLVSDALHPFYKKVLETYIKNYEIDVVYIPCSEEDGRIDENEYKDAIDGEIFAVLVQSPNFFGIVENHDELIRIAHEKNALYIAAFTEALSLGLLKSPGNSGADIVAGEGQSFGIPLSFGGPYLGIFSTKNQYVRKMPGRLVGMTYDTEGRRGFVLTLAAREQHIRREKATSNICTNHGLCALMASIYIAYVGKTGIRNLAERNVELSHYAFEKITSLKGVTPRFNGSFFNEFVLTLPFDATEFARISAEQGIAPGVPLSWFYPKMKNEMLFCVTEMNTLETIETLCRTIEENYLLAGGQND